MTSQSTPPECIISVTPTSAVSPTVSIPRTQQQTAAAYLIQSAYREHRLIVRISQMHAVHRAREEKNQQQLEAEREAERARKLSERQLQGIMLQVWPIVREVLVIMRCIASRICTPIASARLRLLSLLDAHPTHSRSLAVVIVLAGPEAFTGLPVPFAVASEDSPGHQAQSALLGASVAVVGFALLFLSLVLLYVYRCTVALYAVHTAWIGALIGGPLGTMLVRLCEASRVPLDKPTLFFVVANLVAPAVVVVHWSATAKRFATFRRAHAGLLSVLAAWLLASVPYQTSVSALLLLAGLDILLVSFPGSPVQRLDTIATARRRAGEAQMPGLTFKHGSLELGLGDFIVYSAFAAHAARAGAAPLAAATIGILVGLTLTMCFVGLAARRTVVPALPLSVALGATLLAVERIAVQPLARALAANGTVL